MLNIETIKNEIVPWLNKSLENEDIENYEIKIMGTSEKGEGYAGDVIFVKVIGSTKSKKDAELNIVIKMGKRNKIMRDTFSVKEIYEREVYVYDKIFPEFRKFQIERNIKNAFDSVPKCYSTFLFDDIEVIVLENLKTRSYELHDRQNPMNMPHLELVLKNYAKFHAISFAMHDQNKLLFDKLTSNYTCLLKKIMLTENMKIWYQQRSNKVYELIREVDEKLSEKFKKLLEEGLDNKLRNILDEVVDEIVITHGDCWNNNFMFKYEDDNKRCPTEVAILDWQLSYLHSPVLDLSYFLYIVSSEEQISKFDELLMFYHQRLSQYLSELGSDPEKLFPYSTLIKHWKKFSIYGLNFVVTSLDLMLCDKEDAPNFDEIDKHDNLSEEFENMSRVKPKNQDTYQERVLGVVKYYCDTNM